jgi:hypothetical protein
MKVLLKNTWNEFVRVAGEPSSLLALFYAILAFVGTQGIDYLKSNHEARQKYVAERVVGFIETTHEFDALVPLFASKVMEAGKPDEAAKEKLIQNINRQYSEISDLAPLLKQKSDVVQDYTKSLGRLNQELPKIQSVEDMGGYWQAVSDILVARRKLADELRQQASLSLE